MTKIEHSKLSRRKFVTAALAVTSVPIHGAAAQSHEKKPEAPSVSQPSAAAIANERSPLPPDDPQYFVKRPGSDFMVDTIRAANIDYVATTAGSSFRGLHESIINYNAGSKPEMLTVLHEEIAVGMSQGYAKISGRPMLAAVHGTVGLQHATMAIYNAWADRAPSIILAGNMADASLRKAGVEWIHSVQDAGSLVRDFTKWDDQPASLQHFSESFMRAHKIAMTPPMGPALIVIDAELQEEEARGNPSIPKVVQATPPSGDINAVREVARLLCEAENPVLLVDRVARSQAGIDLLVTLAELIAAPVIDRHSRMNMPTRHYLNQGDRGRELIQTADVIVGMEMTDFWGTINQFRDRAHRDWRPIANLSCKLVSITAQDAYLKSNYQDFQRYISTDIAIAGDAQATLPSLIDEVRKALDDNKKSAVESRRATLQAAFNKMQERIRAGAAVAWDAKPVTVARIYAELWDLIRDKDWSLVSDSFYTSFWGQRLWKMEKHYHSTGNTGGYGIGGNLSAAVGAAIANRDQGRISINIQGDGDLMCVPSALWTLAHHQIPLLTIVHNNQGYHQELMHIQRMAARRQRGIDRCHIGTKFDNPYVNYAQLAKSMGVWAEGPVQDPADLRASLVRALDVVKAGSPALIDVVSQPR